MSENAPPRPQCSPLCCRTHWSPLVPNFIAVNLIDIKSVRNLTRVFLLRRNGKGKKKAWHVDPTVQLKYARVPAGGAGFSHK